VVNVSGVTFTSFESTAQWIIANSAHSNSLQFYDAISYMEVVTTMADTFTEIVDNQRKGAGVTLDRPSDQKAIFSFQLDCPTIFTGSHKSAASNPRSLSAFLTFDEFHGLGSRFSGAKAEISKKLDNKAGALMSIITYSEMTREAQLVAKTLLEAAKAFNKELLTFMVTQMEEYGKDTSLSDERCWELTQAIIRIIYGCISKQRLSASEVTIAEAHQPTRGA
jgi:hypothetical protein